MSLSRPVTATYRLQLHADFPFSSAEEQVPYLASLGVSHLYLSPVLQAAAGSTHGYDVVDHTRVSEELGGEKGLLSLADLAHEHGLGLVVDVVPNHMAFVAPEHANAPLWQVLRDGRDAETAEWFDIDWKSGGGRIGLPILGGTLQEALEAGDLELGEHDGQPVVTYFDHVFPVALGTEDGEVGDVLARQHYQLANWRDSDTMLNYRRFFNIAELIAVRVEVPEVFDATHRLLLDLNHRGVIDGFRIDHPDGLADPEGYLHRLREATLPGTHIWVEKILEGTERLPASWACDGTTGYDAMAAVSTALVDPTTAEVLDHTWRKAGGEPDVEHVIARAKRQVVDELLGAEVQRLTRRAREVLPDADPERLHRAVVEILVAGEVYRAYVHPDKRLSPLARSRLQAAYDGAVAARPELADELGHLLELAMAGQGTDDTGDSDDAADDFAIRLQQTWGPVMAKGVEDTTFYRWNRLVALNEVGGNPSALADAGPGALHSWATAQQQSWPLGMTTLSTHDTKRSEDVRSRLLAVAGDGESWRRCSTVFAEAADASGVDRPTAHMLWQTLVGVGEISPERLYGYLEKALREAKEHTAWVDGDEEYESRVAALADRAVAPGPLRDVVEQAQRVNQEAMRATVLATKLLQLLLPGVPDVYQGCEIVNLSLVDPDNRREVDYGDRARRLSGLDEEAPGQAAAGAGSRDLDDEKLLVTSRALRLRREQPDLFGEEASYEPLRSSSEHALGFVRTGRVACVVTRAPHRLLHGDGWGRATVDLPEGTWHDLLTGRRHEGGEIGCADLLERLPVALLVQDS